MARVLIADGYVAMSEIATPATPLSGEVKIFPPTQTIPTIGVLDDAGVLGKLAFSGAFTLTVGATGTAALASSGTFTPSLTFGGAATGMTFTSRTGRWQRFANMIRVEGFILLSAKGSSTGAAVITSLPVAGEATSLNFQPATLRLNTMASISGYIQAFLSPSGTTIELEHLGTGSAAALTDANFNNTSNIVFSLWYEV